MLRDALFAETRRMVALEADKHLVKLSATEMHSRLPERLYSTLP